MIYYVYVEISENCKCNNKIKCGKEMLNIEADNDDEFDIKLYNTVKDYYNNKIKFNNMIVWKVKPATINLELMYKNIGK